MNDFRARLMEWRKEGRCRGGRSRSPAKIAASRENGKLGGRPSLARAETQLRKKLGLSASEPIDLKQLVQGLDSAFRRLQEASDARKLADAHQQHRIEAITFATQKIIEAGYKVMAHKCHPDFPTRPAPDRPSMQEVNAAIIWLRSMIGSQIQEEQS